MRRLKVKIDEEWYWWDGSPWDLLPRGGPDVPLSPAKPHIPSPFAAVIKRGLARGYVGPLPAIVQDVETDQ